MTLHAHVVSSSFLKEKIPPSRPAGFHRSSVGLGCGGRGISLPRWKRDNPAMVAPFRQLAEIAQHLQCLFVAIGQMREDLGGDPAQMGIIRYHMRSPARHTPPPRCIWNGYAGIPAWQAECRGMVNAKGGRTRPRITRLPRRCRAALRWKPPAANRTSTEAQSRAAHTKASAQRLIIRMADVNGCDRAIVVTLRGARQMSSH